MNRAPSPTSTVLDDLFGALADPTRRALFTRLLHDGPQTATVLAADRALSRQAVVKHLQALAASGLASSERVGREVRYVATPERLTAVVAWLVESSGQWDRRIERLLGRVGAMPEAQIDAPHQQRGTVGPE
ncbi:MAG: hypothetical protein JWL72_3066 [Ilumatobacteraceae bacterium]|nr:hypothetical protein [Ilumatobacteraceae bacterium]